MKVTPRLQSQVPAMTLRVIRLCSSSHARAYADLQNSIKFVQYLLETLIAALEEKMGARSSKLGPDDDKRLDKLRKRRLTGNSKGSSGSVNAIPANVQDSPYGSRATNGMFVTCS